MSKYYKTAAAAKKVCDSYVIPMVVIRYVRAFVYEVAVPGREQYVEAEVVYRNAAAQEAAA